MLGRVHDKLVGPHPIRMVQVAFDVDSFVPWPMLHHDNLSVLVHPLAGNALPEHRDYAAWIGTPLSLRLEVFEHL